MIGPRHWKVDQRLRPKPRGRRSEEDFDANGKLSRFLLAGLRGQPHSSLEEDCNARTYSGYRAYYTGISGPSDTGEEVDVSAANAVTKVVYAGRTVAPYS